MQAKKAKVSKAAAAAAARPTARLGIAIDPDLKTRLQHAAIDHGLDMQVIAAKGIVMALDDLDKGGIR